VEVLGQVRQVALEAYDHKDLPLQEILREVGSRRSSRVTAQLPALFTYQNFPPPVIALADTRTTPITFQVPAAKADWSLTVWRFGEGFRLNLVAQGATSADSGFVASHYLEVLTRIASDDLMQSCTEVASIPPAYHDELRAQWMLASRNYDRIPFDKKVIAQVALTPDQTCYVQGEERITFRTLMDRSAWLVRQLHQHDVGDGDFVPIVFNQPLAFAIGALAVAMAGAAFVPVSPSWPDERIRHALKELRPKAVIGDDTLEARFGNGVMRLLSLPAVVPSASEHLSRSRAESAAYAIYTSGSTGIPKAAIVSHGSLANRFEWMTEYFGAAAARSVLQTTRPEFDSAIWQIFWPLCHGGMAVLGADGIDGLSRLPGLVREHRITLTDFVPSSLRLLLHDTPEHQLREALLSLECVIVGGEEFDRECLDLLRDLVPAIRLVNLYGPTEATIGCIAYTLGESVPRLVPIGEPIANVRAAVVDDHDNLQPPGVAGELILGGQCVGMGYVEQAHGPSPFFKSLVFGQSEHSYRTGDICVRQRDGQFVYLGRKDNQFKIAGLRIHPFEIEAALRANPGIRHVLIEKIQLGGTGTFALAYAADGADTTEQDVRKLLLRQIPAWMMPHAIVKLERWPLAAGGKTDRRQVHRILEQAVSDKTADPVSKDIDHWLANAWLQEMGAALPSREVRLFAAGADSMALVRLHARARAELGLENLRLLDLYQAADIAGLSRLLQESKIEAN
jgi:amino acid adenylation domain-containing protein